MDFSPCKIEKLKLHSRVESYLKESTLDYRRKLELTDGLKIRPIAFQTMGLKNMAKARKIESYKPSSSVYKKLNAKIYVKNLEFLKSYSSSPQNKDRYRRELVKNFSRHHEGYLEKIKDKEEN